MGTEVLNLQSFYEKLRTHVELLNESIEPSEFFIIQCLILVQNECFQFWL